jgi:hypothetical protein
LDKNGISSLKDQILLQVLHFGFTTIAQLTLTIMELITELTLPGHLKLTAVPIQTVLLPEILQF